MFYSIRTIDYYCLRRFFFFLLDFFLFFHLSNSFAHRKMSYKENNAIDFKTGTINFTKNLSSNILWNFRQKQKIFKVMAIHFMTKFLKLLSLFHFSKCLSQGDPSGFASVSYFEGKWNLVPR